MNTVVAIESPAPLVALVDLVGRGQRIVITRQGRPLAEMGPCAPQPPRVAPVDHPCHRCLSQAEIRAWIDDVRG